MTDSSRDSANFCYRHPDRASFVLCQRCGRTICPECQTPAAVGVHCPECVREARQSAPRRKPAILSAVRRTTGSDAPVVSYGIIGLCAVIYVLQLVSGGAVTDALFYHPALTALQPWRMITSLFVHSPQSILHILFNMYALLIFGPILEHAVGRYRFLALYLLSGLGGSVAVLLLAPLQGVVGASGAIFGLFGAFFVIQRRLGGNSLQLLIVIGLNLAIGFIVPNIAWQAHVGGLIVGSVVALALLRTRERSKRTEQILLLCGILAALIVITVVGVGWLSARLFG